MNFRQLARLVWQFSFGKRDRPTPSISQEIYVGLIGISVQFLRVAYQTASISPDRIGLDWS